MSLPSRDAGPINAEQHDRTPPIQPEPPANQSDVVRPGVGDSWAAGPGLHLLAPPPAGDFRHVVAVLANVLLVLYQLVSQRLLGISCSTTQLRQSVDHVHHQ